MMRSMVIGIQLLSGPADVLMGTVHDERLAIPIPFPHLPAVQHPDPVPILVAHSGLTLVER